MSQRLNKKPSYDNEDIQPTLNDQDMSGVHDFISKIDRMDTDITKKYDKFDENIDLNNRIGDPLESDIKRTTTSKKPPTTNLAYGKNKPKKEGTTADEKDRIINLSKENRLLKEKENLLEKEILKLNTKLRRIDNLARSVSHMQANDPSNQHGNVDMVSLQTELQDQLTSLRDENQRKKKKNYQLKEIEKDLKFKAKNSHLPTTSHNSKYDHVQGKLGFTRMSKGNQSYLNLIDELKQTLVQNQRQLLVLQKEKEKLGARQSGVYSIDQLQNQIQSMNKEISDINYEMDKIKNDNTRNETMFKESTNYMNELQTQKNEVSHHIMNLRRKNYELKLRASQAKDLQLESKNLDDEIKGTERAIRNLTTEPFIKKQQGESTGNRIADLEAKLAAKTKQLHDRQEEEREIDQEAEALRTEYENIQGEKLFLENENDKLHAQYKEIADKNHVDIWNSLFQVDPQQYQQTMTDLAKNTAVNPTWKNIDFLERDGRQIDFNDPLKVDLEVKRLKHENQEFAAELEKAQNLLNLQKDIERENTRYYENEKKRLQLVLKNNQSKKEDLAKRADDKLKQIEDLKKMAGLDKTSLAGKSGLLGTSAADASTESTNDGFSVMSNEPDLPTDENMLDLKIINAELFKDRFTSIIDREAGISASNTFITLATVEYFNHETQCSKPAHGFSPLYNSQFSFPNKVDEFYVNKLMTQPLQIDIYIVRNNNPIHLGSCKLYVRELVEQETALQDYSLKPPVLEKTIQILPAGLLARSQLSEKAKEEPVGQITVKMRMRKQISQAMRFYREKNEIENLTKQKQVMQNETGNLKARRRMITIEIIRARNIKPKYGDMTSIQPFFYYQFYDKTDKYSYTCSGINPEFNDVENYEIMFDAKAIDYFERQKLKVFIMDENSPITGQEKGGQAFGDDDENADLIGVADIDMINLIQNGVVQDSFPIRDLERKMVGDLEVRCTSRDIESHVEQKNALTEVSYSEQWQDDIIQRIAKKLAKFNCEVSLMFGIFSRGARSVSKEDFKYCILQRLNLRKNLADREIDIFLNEHPQLVGQESITQDQFCTLFAKAITGARNDTLNKEAYEMSLVHRYNEVSATMRDQQQADLASGKKIKPENIIEKNSNLNLQEKDAFVILLPCLKNGQIDLMQQTLKNYSKNDNIDMSRFRQVLIHEGQISDYDSGKIAQMLEYDGTISINRFNDFVEKLTPFGQTESAAFQKFLKLCQSHGELICQKLESQDLNKDGDLNADGFKAAMLEKQLGLSVEEIEEIFNLTRKNHMLTYVEFLKSIDPQLLQFLSTTLKRQATSRSQLDQSANALTIKDDLTETHMTIQEQQLIEAPKLKSAKQKVEMFITAQNTLLSVIFQVIDADLNNSLSLQEFKQRMVALGISLDSDEIEVLFKSLDMNGNGNISFKEFVQQFSHINVTQLIKRMNKMITDSKVPPLMIFEKFSTDTYRTQISKTDFKELVFSFIDKPHDFEINSLFSHFDSNKKGFITKADFENAFGKEVNEQEFNSGIEDLIKPLATMFKRRNEKVRDYFHKNFDQRNIAKLSPQVIYDAICKNIPHFEDLHNHREVADQEVNTIKEYIKNQFNTTEMRYMDLKKLLEHHEFKNKCSQPEAVKQLASVKSKIDNRGTQSRSHFLPFKEVIDVRSFKHKIHQLNALNQYAIDNMTKYLDKKNEGFIYLEQFENELKRARAMQGSSNRR